MYGSSYRAESVALDKALSWLIENNEGGKIHVYTDSKSLVQRLESGFYSTRNQLEDSIWQKIIELCGTSTNPNEVWYNGSLRIVELKATMKLIDWLM